MQVIVFSGKMQQYQVVFWQQKEGCIPGRQAINKLIFTFKKIY